MQAKDMSQMVSPSRFQEVIETVESLPPTDQMLLIEIIRQRLVEQRRAEIVKDVAEARWAYQHNRVERGTVFDLMRELAT
jgi:chorismate mutase